MIDAVMNLAQLLLPNEGNTDLVTFGVKIDGSSIASEFEVKSIVVYKGANKIAYARVMVLDGYVDRQDFPASNQNTFSPGKSIEIQAGYHNKNKTIFKGIITKHCVRIRRGQSNMMEIECRDAAVKMTIARQNKYYDNQSDSEIIKDIIGGHGGISSGKIEQTDVTHPHMVQYHATDWDFIVTRAEANGMLVFANDGEIAVQKPDFDQDPALALTFGSTIEEFEGEMDARDQYPAVKASAWDYSNQEVIEGEDSLDGGRGGIGGFQAPAAVQSVASSVGINLPGAPPDTDHSRALDVKALIGQHAGMRSDVELNAWAKAQMTKSKLAKRQGRVKFEGVQKIKPGQVIALQGVGGRFSEKVYVTAVRHEISNGNWYTNAQFGLPQRWFAEDYDLQAPPASGLLPAINGLQIGIVTKIDADPAGEDRVRVRLPLMGGNEDGIWARMACLDAGDNRGSFFRPYVGDEVIVGFVNDDPRDPIVLGMLNSSAKPAPFQATEDNFEKGFFTKEQLQIKFNEDHKSITLSTPSGKKITLDENQGVIELQDENNNKITLDANGITIDAVTTLTLKAGTEIKLEAPTVAVSASAKFSAESQGIAELKGQGQTVVKGGIVMIN